MALPNREPVLWGKLVALPLDRLAEEPAPAVGFVKRLMRDEKWDYATAVRVSAEYRRFLLLAHLGPVAPSPMVDAAWHLHLTYTRAYNVGLCERVLNRTLDHEPSGGAADTLRYDGVYRETLARYRELFGEEPPRDIWPGGDAPARAPTRTKGVGRWIFGAVALVMGWLLIRPPLIGMLFMAIFAVIAIAGSDAEAKKRKGDGGSCGGSCGSNGDGGSCGSGCGGGCGGGD